MPEVTSLQQESRHTWLQFILRLIIHMSTVIYRLKTISVNIIRLHFDFIALFAQNLCTTIYMQVQYRILVANYITPDGKRTILNISSCWH